MTKTLVVNVPRVEPHRPPAGAAIVANICKLQGHDVTCLDLNLEFFHFCKDRNIDYYGFDSVWDNYASPDTEQQKTLNEFIITWSTFIAQKNFDHILISVLHERPIFHGKIFRAIATADTGQNCRRWHGRVLHRTQA